MEDKDKEIAATNRLLNIIRGDEGDYSPQQKAVKTSSNDEQKEAQKKETGWKTGGNQDNSASAIKVQEKFSPLPQSGSPPAQAIFQKKEKRPSWLSWIRNSEKKALGVDIGSYSLKYVLVQKGIGGIKLLDYNIVDLHPEGGGDADGGMSPEKALRSMVSGIDLDSTKVISSVSGPSVIVRHVQFPQMSEKELMSSLNWEARSYIPFPLDEINLDYQILPRKEKDRRLDVILVSVTKKLLRSHLDLLESAYIEPAIVDINPLSMINTYMMTCNDNEAKTIALLNMGAQSSSLSIYRIGSLFFTRDIRIGGNSFTKLVQSKFKISYAEAESIKKGASGNDTPTEKTQDMQNIFKPLLDELILETRRSLIYYDNQTGKKGFSFIVLTGGGSLLNGLPETLESELDIPVQFLEPFRKLRLEGVVSPALLKKEISERLSLSIGLALRGIS
ncbi:type IV pilus assembly protein PilM [bacterium]|nr:type IV pilus assembly protein PilM [bacterium]